MQIQANTSLISMVERNSSSTNATNSNATSTNTNNTYQEAESSTIPEDPMAMGLSNTLFNADKASAVAEKTLNKAVDEINNKMKILSINNAQFDCSIHEKTGKVILKIVDSKTKEVIKEIPSEKTLDMLAKDWEIQGLLMDKKL